MAITPGYVRSTFGDDFKDIDQAFIIKDFQITVKYTRGTDVIASLLVIAGEVVTEYDDTTGIDLAIGDSSFWIDPDLLTFGDGPFQPALHDQIENSLGQVFDVLQPGELDPESAMIIVPTIQVEYLPAPTGS